MVGRETFCYTVAGNLWCGEKRSGIQWQATCGVARNVLVYSGRQLVVWRETFWYTVAGNLWGRETFWYTVAGNLWCGEKRSGIQWQATCWGRETFWYTVSCNLGRETFWYTVAGNLLGVRNVTAHSGRQLVCMGRRGYRGGGGARNPPPLRLSAIFVLYSNPQMLIFPCPLNFIVVFSLPN